MNKIENILFVHPLEGNAHEIFKAFNRHSKVKIFPLIENIHKESTRLIEKLMYKIKLPLDKYEVNKKLLEYNLSFINIIFVIKGNEIKPKTLAYIKSNYPHIKLINFSLDDMFAKHNRSIYYTNSLPFYDLVVTTKSYNIKELFSIGAKKILFTYQAFSKDIHKPIYNIKKYNHDVLFIGFPEKERIDSILYLANNNIKIDIYGYPNAWLKYNIVHPNINNHRKPLIGEDYSEAITNSKISLCFLRKINRDLHTSRSIEIPACKGFMLAERTKEHLDLFEEDTEAVYFESDEELLKKINYYLSNEKDRLTIMENGYKKCISHNYSYDNMVNVILETIEND